jgi:DNA-binding CsgD family transcriptional regulator/tetratricopeptide (TPR) repeat protein
MIGSMAGRHVSPVTVGREAELEAIDRVLDGWLTGRPTHVLVGGEAGVGKSRLIRDMTAAAEARGATVLVGECVALGMEGGPFSPFVDALRPLARALDPAILAAAVDAGGPALERIVPELVRAIGSVGSSTGADRTGQVVDAIRAFLIRLAETTPLLLVVEDVHWADPATLETVAWIVRATQKERLLIVITYRSDELHRRHKLLPWLAELERHTPLERINLRRLDVGETRRLIAAIADDPSVDPELVERIHRRCGGNPFFVEELLQAEQAGEKRLPDTLREVLLARLSALPDAAQRLVGVAAVAGRRMDDDLLRSVADLSDAEFDAALRSAIEQGVLVGDSREPNDGYAFRHALLQEAAYDDLLPGERRHLHRRFARALSEEADPVGSNAGRWADLAHHWAAAGQSEMAFGASIRAGDTALEAYAFMSALFQFERALELWTSVADPEDVSGLDHAGLLERAGLAALLEADLRRSVQFRREAVASLPAARPPERAAVANERLGRSLWLLGESAAAIEAYSAAVRLVDGAPPTAEQARVLAGSAQMDMLLGRWESSRAGATHAIEVARAVGDTVVEGHALCTYGAALAGIGRCDGAIAALREAIDIARRVRSPDDIGRGYVSLIDALGHCGRHAEAVVLVEEGLAAAREVGVERAYARTIRLGGVPPSVASGAWDTARLLAAAALDDPRKGRSAEVYGLAYTCCFDVASGDPDATARLARLSELVLDYPTEPHYEGPFHRANVEHLLWAGRPREALDAATFGLERLRPIEGHLHRVALQRLGLWAIADLAQSVRARRDRSALAEVLARGEDLAEQQATIVASVPAGSATRDPEAERASSIAELCRMRGTSSVDAWATAASMWEALGQPYPAAVARWRLAGAYLEAREGAGAATELGHAHATAVRLGATPLRLAIEGLARRARLDLSPGAIAGEKRPTRERGDSTRDANEFGLTKRELEVVRLVADGRSNRQIADELFISENTAGVHVSNILGKLGASSRAEAAAVAVRAGIAGS